MLIVTLEDARSITNSKQQFCTKGIRAFFNKYDLDYQDFRRNGIDAEKLIATGDSMAMQVVEVARGRQH